MFFKKNLQQFTPSPATPTVFNQTMAARLFSTFSYPLTKFVTKVVTADNEPIDVNIAHHDGSVQHSVFVKSYNGDKALGDMRYFIWEDHVYIHAMHNTSPYRHIGSLLHEYAFRDSIRHGRNGDIRIVASFSSHYFHFQQGFRPYPETQMIRRFDVSQMMDLLTAHEEYLRHPNNPLTEQQLYDCIRKHNLEETLKQHTQAELNITSNTPVSLTDMMLHGFFRKTNLTREWEEKFSAMPLNQRKNTATWGNCEMRYPNTVIQQKKELFGLAAPEAKPAPNPSSANGYRK